MYELEIPTPLARKLEVLQVNSLSPDRVADCAIRLALSTYRCENHQAASLAEEALSPSIVQEQMPQRSAESRQSE